MKRYLAYGLGMCLMWLTFQGRAETWTVGRGGRIRTLASAVEKAKAYDTIRMEAGMYQVKQPIIISKPLVILGNGDVILDGGGVTGLFKVFAPQVTIAGFTLQNTGNSYTEDRAAILVAKSDSVCILNNHILNTFFAIYFQKSAYGRVENNVITGNAKEEFSSANGIHLWYCKNMLIRNNQITHHRDGIYFEFVDDSRIEENKSHDNLRYGLHFMFSDHDTYIRNTFEQNGAGVAVMFSHFIKMRHNRFLNNLGASSYGILLKEIYDSDIQQNTFFKNTMGIYAESATRVHIHHNEFTSNGWGIRLMGSSMGDTINYNNFRGNSFNVSSSSDMNYNLFAHNYWSDYSGYDLNHDGIGDVPYRLMSLFSYLVAEHGESIILMHSLFMNLLDFTEKVMPAVTPVSLVDAAPLMKPVP